VFQKPWACLPSDVDWKQCFNPAALSRRQRIKMFFCATFSSVCLAAQIVHPNPCSIVGLKGPRIARHLKLQGLRQDANASANTLPAAFAFQLHPSSSTSKALQNRKWIKNIDRTSMLCTERKLQFKGSVSLTRPLRRHPCIGLGCNHQEFSVKQERVGFRFSTARFEYEQRQMDRCCPIVPGAIIGGKSTGPVSSTAQGPLSRCPTACPCQSCLDSMGQTLLTPAPAPLPAPADDVTLEAARKPSRRRLP